MSVNNKTSLTPGRRWLVQRMHNTNFGTMHNLVVREGEPIVTPPPKIKQAFKLGGKYRATKGNARDFTLKDQHEELFELMDRKQNGTITKLVIQDGLPLLVEWEDDEA